MGIVIPRPPIRTREARIIAARLKRHDELRRQFEGEGLCREDASRKAFEIVKREKFN